MNPARKYLVGFALGATTAIGGMWLLGVPRERERVVEVEKIVERVNEKPVAASKPGRADLIVMQGGKASGLNSDFSEFFVDEARRLPEVESVSAVVVDVVDVIRESGVTDTVLLQGWRPDNFGYDTLKLHSGRTLRDGDTRTLLLGHKLATNLNKKVGDKLVFGGDPDHPYEVAGIFKSAVSFESGGAIVPFKDGQALTGKRVTGFSVRVKKTSPDGKAEVEAVRLQIEALRDPNDPTVRLSATSPNGGEP